MTPNAATSFGGTLFDTEFLRQLELLRFVSKQVQPGQIRGERRAKRRGSGLQFADYRPYVAGDDTRHVDWRAYLRLGRLLMRLFEEEADLPIDLLIDASHSMTTGDPAKFDQARRLAGALGYIGLLNHDRVRVVAFSTGAMEELPRRRGPNQVWPTLRFLDRLQAHGGTSLLTGLDGCLAPRRRKGLLVLISDFLDPEGFEPAFDRLRPRGEDVFILHVSSPDEMDPSLEDEVILEDSESGESLRVTPALRRRYLELRAELCDSIETYCNRYGWGYVHAGSDERFEELVMQVLRSNRFVR